MANIRRNIASPLSLGLGEIGVDKKKNVWLRISDSEALHLSGVPGSIVRVIGGSGQRVVVPSAGSGSSSTSIKDAADLITNTTAFAGLLSAADTNVQLALDTLDDHTHVHSTNTLLLVDDHTIYALLLGRAGGQSLSGGNAANDDLTLQGTTHATRTTSYVLLQPNGGVVSIGTGTPDNTYSLDVQYATAYVRFRSTTGTNYALFKMTNTGGDFYIGRENSAGGGMGTGTSAYAGVINSQNTYPFQLLVNNSIVMTLRSTQRVGLATVTDPTARLHLPAGTATASTAPLKLTSGVANTAAEAGAMEWDGTSLTIVQTTGPTRKTLAFTTDITATKLDDLAAPDDNTDLNVSTTAHGLAPKLPNDVTKYLDGTGAYSVPAGSGSGTQIYYGASAEGDDDYVITPSPALGAYAAGVIVLLLPDVANTGACTINVSGLGVVNIKDASGGDPAGNAIYAGTPVFLIYSATGPSFRLQQ